MTHESALEESIQEVLEGLWQHHEEGRPLARDATEAPVREALAARGWLVEGKLELTPSGIAVAAAAIRRHRLAERMLADILGQQHEGSEEHACRLEHSLVAGLDDKVCTFLGHPRVCPHGHRIPEGSCCKTPAIEVAPAVASLSTLKPGEEGVVAYIAAPDGQDLQKFLSMGLHPGDPVVLVRKTPTIVFRAGNSQFAIDRDLAVQIFVRR